MLQLLIDASDGILETNDWIILMFSLYDTPAATMCVNTAWISYFVTA